MTRRIVSRVLLASVALAWLSCTGPWPTYDFFDASCPNAPCGWQVQTGSLERTASWHKGDRAFTFVATPTRISRFALGTGYGNCLRFDIVADVEESAGLELQLDFNADDPIDAIDHRIPVPVGRWERSALQARAPADFRVLNVALEKRGTGHAAVALFRIGRGDCGQPQIALRDGSACGQDSTCASGRCLGGVCRSCGAGGCLEEEACRSDDECADGKCAGGVCRACAKSGTCAAASRCSSDQHCASKLCSAGALPSMTGFPAHDGLCGECGQDSECAPGFCVLGRCSACRSDADCPPAAPQCRYLDPFDAQTRACGPALAGPLPRGALCEADQDCARWLRCAASAGRAKRCGIACGADTDCGVGEVCGAPGVYHKRSLPEDAGADASPVALGTVHLLPSWQDRSSRVRTCFEQVGFEDACEIHEQCAHACCDQRCGYGTVDLTSGSCGEVVSTPASLP